MITIKLGDIDFGDKYLWNKTDYIDIQTSMAYRPLTQSELESCDNKNLMHFTQCFTKFEGESVEFDPEFRMFFRERSLTGEDDDNGDEKKEDLMGLIIIIVVIFACAGLATIVTFIIVKRVRS